MTPLMSGALALCSLWALTPIRTGTSLILLAVSGRGPRMQEASQPCWCSPPYTNSPARAPQQALGFSYSWGKREGCRPCWLPEGAAFLVVVAPGERSRDRSAVAQAVPHRTPPATGLIPAATDSFQVARWHSKHRLGLYSVVHILYGCDAVTVILLQVLASRALSPNKCNLCI